METPAGPSASLLGSIEAIIHPDDDTNHTPPSREDIVANILHILSSSTEVSPLLCRCDWGEKSTDEEGHGSIISWDPFMSFHYAMPDIDSGVATHSNFLLNWLVEFLPILRCHQHTNLGGTGDEECMIQVMYAFINTSQMNKLMSGNNKPSDDFLWQVGLELLKTHLYPDEESDADDDDDNDGDDENHLRLDPIPPHELLRTVMDSYYCSDKDLEMGELSAIEVEMPSEQIYRLPSSIAVFLLRALLVSRALESAEESIPDSPGSSETVIRWRRLKSMVDDSLSLFQRMLFDYVGMTIDNFDYGRDPKALKLYPVNPEHITSIAAWIYTNHVFPSCHDLMYVHLWNNTNSSNGFGVKTLKTCYESFKMLTTLLVLDVAVVDQEHSSPSRCVQWVLHRIESRSTSDFFDRMKSAQKNTTHKDASLYCPWNDRGPGFDGRGLSLEEDLLLYPSLRKKYDNSDQASSYTFYDEMGIAVIAYWKLWAQARPQTDSSSLAVDPLSYCWTLLFPHIITFLCATRASSTIVKMDEGEYLSRSDEYLVGINFTITRQGFEMLDTLITKTPAIRPMSCCTATQNPVVRWAHSAQGLESTITVLLSHVVRISSIEAQRGNKPPSEVYPALKYSSLDVMKMTRTLLGFYNPAIQVHTLSMVCEHIKKNQDRVILPQALDFLRPIIMEMCKNTGQYHDGVTALDDMATMQKIVEVLDIFLTDLHYAFGDSASPLPEEAEEFMCCTEIYSSVFAIIRLQRLWISRCQTAVEEEVMQDEKVLGYYNGIVKWIDGCLDKLQSFDSSLSSLINFWQTSEEPPPDLHRLFLMQMTLQEAFQA